MQYTDKQTNGHDFPIMRPFYISQNVHKTLANLRLTFFFPQSATEPDPKIGSKSISLKSLFKIINDLRPVRRKPYCSCAACHRECASHKLLTFYILIPLSILFLPSWIHSIRLVWVKIHPQYTWSHMQTVTALTSVRVQLWIFCFPVSYLKTTNIRNYHYLWLCMDVKLSLSP